MWLSADERKLLQGYYHRLGAPDQCLTFTARAWHKVLDTRASKLKDVAGDVSDWGETGGEGPYSKSASADEMKAQISRMLKYDSRTTIANRLLGARGLVRLEPRDPPDDHVFAVELTVEGYDLGRRYASWFGRSGELFKAYREHWVWLIVGFIGGVLGGLLVQWLA